MVPPQGGKTGVFDGFWEATFASGSTVRLTTVCISGTNVWHNYESFAKFRELNFSTCVIITRDEDVKGHLSGDGCSIEWEDGDVWRRAQREPAAASFAPSPGDIGAGGAQGSDAAPEAQRELAGVVTPLVPTSSLAPQPPAGDAAGKGNRAAEEAVSALLRKDAKALREALESGAPVDGDLPAERLWRQLRWELLWRGELPRTTLLMGAVLLEWPEGVQLCVERNADVNAMYAGPLRSVDGQLPCPGSTTALEAVPVLRASLSVRGPAQCVIVHHLLTGPVKMRRQTVQVLRRKAKKEMELVTAGLLDRFDGPFLEAR